MKKGGKIGLIIALIAGLIALKFDAVISQFVASFRSFAADIFFLGFTFEIQTFVILFFLTSLFLFKEQKRRWIIPLWMTALGAAIISYLLKIIFIRARPFEAGVVTVLSLAFNLLGKSIYTWNFSFPSFQAVLAFSALPLLDKEFRKFKWVWFAIACLIGLSRVYFGIHYASDVILGSAIGYVIGLCFVKLEERYKFGKKANKGIKKFLKNLK